MSSICEKIQNEELEKLENEISLKLIEFPGTEQEFLDQANAELQRRSIERLEIIQNKELEALTQKHKPKLDQIEKKQE